VASKIDILILSLLGSEFLIGLYGVVIQLMQPFMIISTSLTSAAFPAISKAVYLGKEMQRQEAENLLKSLLCMALPFSLGLVFFGKELLLLIYNDPSFTQVTLVLSIMSLTVITSSFSRVFSYVLIANGFEKFNLLEVTITTAVGPLLGVLLISQYKLMGAALMCLAMSFTNVSILMYAVYSRIFQLRLWQFMRRPLLISVLMSIVFLILKNINLNFLWTLSISILVYSALVGLLVMREFGGFSSVWQKFLRKG
ncbi:MAG TPA: polysaccharide biosynthesis C-terminal domain-containing protein, partial [Oculatellaceae cyanobacterium]